MADVVEEKPPAVTAAEGGEEEEEEDGEEELAPLVKRTNIIYCGVCSIPPEFCEYNPPDLYADCLKWQAKHHPELLPEGKTVEDMLAKLSLKSGGGGGAGVATAKPSADAPAEGEEGAAEGGEDADGDEEEGKKKKKGGPKGIKKKEAAGSGGKVTIMRMSRNKRKSITVITGLDTYPELKLKDVAKAMGKLFASGASVSDTASGGKEIVIQGDVIEGVAAMLEEKYQVPEKNIILKS